MRTVGCVSVAETESFRFRRRVRVPVTVTVTFCGVWRGGCVDMICLGRQLHTLRAHATWDVG